ncbi:hypothetical protein EGR_10209 [Echinococcus granulosus]|uniref:Uncharacterized protein n=1 Tax=Echinococcus granulosus TaxID=6210 RepID=W6U8S9_ECHGR|nr:hypothetical protein EGR_10209 [Echinococcus granulosus]EUB54927.1 hypothetical protein EGR_10209 [Echinococcus granulosus]
MISTLTSKFDYFSIKIEGWNHSHIRQKHLLPNKSKRVQQRAFIETRIVDLMPFLIRNIIQAKFIRFLPECGVWQHIQIQKIVPPRNGFYAPYHSYFIITPLICAMCFLVIYDTWGQNKSWIVQRMFGFKTVGLLKVKCISICTALVLPLERKPFTCQHNSKYFAHRSDLNMHISGVYQSKLRSSQTKKMCVFKLLRCEENLLQCGQVSGFFSRMVYIKGNQTHYLKITYFTLVKPRDVPLAIGPLLSYLHQHRSNPDYCVIAKIKMFCAPQCLCKAHAAENLSNGSFDNEFVFVWAEQPFPSLFTVECSACKVVLESSDHWLNLFKWLGISWCAKTAYNFKSFVHFSGLISSSPLLNKLESIMRLEILIKH